MGAQTKQIKIDGFDKVFTVHELTVAQLMELFDSIQGLEKDASVLDMFTNASDKLGLLGTATWEDLKVMAPSEIKVLYEGFMEVNDSFFEVARSLGAEGLLIRIRAVLVEDFYGLFASAMHEDSGALNITPTAIL